jgi:hypothetical protein
MDEMNKITAALAERAAGRRINDEHGGEATLRDIIAVLRELGWRPPGEIQPQNGSAEPLQAFIRQMRAHADWHRDWGRPQPARAIDNALERVMQIQGIEEGSVGDDQPDIEGSADARIVPG